jgi:hypothetical protein
LLLMTAGIVIDLMRAFETFHQLEFGAQSAALYGLSLSTNANGSYKPAQAQANIQAAIDTVAANSWNIAQAGPQNGFSGIWSKPITLNQAQFVTNPLDANEFFVQVTSARTGVDALQQFFLPLVNAGLPTKQVAPQAQRSSPSSTVEVLGQPATRIGYGAPLNSAPGSRAGDLVGFATFPLAISNVQFAQISASNQAMMTIDLVSSPPSQTPTQKGHIQGCFVNVAGTGNGANFYGPGQGNLAIDQLEGLLGYFRATSNQPPIAPAVVEQGSPLSAFNPADPTFSARLLEINQTLATVSPPPRVYIIPVLKQNPSFTTTNLVVGFAYLQLSITVPPNGTQPVAPTIIATLQASVPVRNASSAAGYSGIPGNTTNLMPPPSVAPPVAPFIPRQVDVATNGVIPAPRGIVLAPAVSPRQIALPIVPKS